MASYTMDSSYNTVSSFIHQGKFEAMKVVSGVLSQQQSQNIPLFIL